MVSVASFRIDTRGAGTGGEPTTKTRQARVYVDALKRITNVTLFISVKTNLDNADDVEHLAVVGNRAGTAASDNDEHDSVTDKVSSNFEINKVNDIDILVARHNNKTVVGVD